MEQCVPVLALMLRCMQRRMLRRPHLLFMYTGSLLLTLGTGYTQDMPQIPPRQQPINHIAAIAGNGSSWRRVHDQFYEYNAPGQILTIDRKTLSVTTKFWHGGLTYPLDSTQSRAFQVFLNQERGCLVRLVNDELAVIREWMVKDNIFSAQLAGTQLVLFSQPFTDPKSTWIIHPDKAEAALFPGAESALASGPYLLLLKPNHMILYKDRQIQWTRGRVWLTRLAEDGTVLGILTKTTNEVVEHEFIVITAEGILKVLATTRHSPVSSFIADLSPDGTHALIGFDTNFQVTNTRDGRTLWTGGKLQPHGVPLESFVFNDGKIAIWQTQWGKTPHDAKGTGRICSFIEIWDNQGKRIWGTDVWPCFPTAPRSNMVAHDNHVDLVTNCGLMRFAIPAAGE